MMLLNGQYLGLSTYHILCRLTILLRTNEPPFKSTVHHTVRDNYSLQAS